MKTYQNHAMTDAEARQALADACGVTRQTIIALEAGRYAPSLELGFRIADALGVRIEDVFHWTRPA